MNADQKRAQIRVLLRKFSVAACILLALPLLFGFLGTYGSRLDAFSHFRTYFSVALAVLAVAALILRAWIAGTAALLFAAASFATTIAALNLPFSGPPRLKLVAADGTEPVYRLLQINLRFDNPTPEKVLSLIGRMQPDVVTMDEVSPMWAGKLKLIKAAYPNQVICPTRIEIGGAAIISRRPFAEADSSSCDDRGAFATARIDFGGRVAEIADIHLGWPWPGDQRWQLKRLGGVLKGLDDTTLLAGDYNAVRWSATVYKAARDGNFKLVPPAGATWFYRRFPVWLRPYFGIEIDHIMAKGDLVIHSTRILPDVGSDHAPVLVEFSVLPKPEPSQEPVRTVSPLVVGMG
jgi:endonuclease/exonuclease/phosphatase (EEP) superfamily protein YafD